MERWTECRTFHNVGIDALEHAQVPVQGTR